MAGAAESTAPAPGAPSAVLEQGTYEVIRSRLAAHGTDLRERLVRLNQARQEVFGTIQTTLLATDRITTKNKCSPRDMISLGKHRFLFGYNVHVGLRFETQLSDVFAIYERHDHQFRELPLDLLGDGNFKEDFASLYQYYRQTVFAKFSIIGPHLFMVFQVGKTPNDIKTFKWLIRDDGLKYLGNRSDHEFVFPSQHEFEWTRTHRELHRFGLHPHISIQDRVFVETIGGDLTIKIEDNTETGAGIYSEPVQEKDQTLDDAEIYFASVGSLVLLKIRPYQEKAFRYLVFNEKLRQVERIDAIEDACVLLPDNHGIIFSSGYYLQTGEHKTFESTLSGMKFDGRVASPNGEDHLYTFYHPESGSYILMSYNVIAQKVELPINCGGFSLFENGEMALFKPDPEPQKHHVIQIWQTPYTTQIQPAVEQKDSFLFKIGNPDIVGAMAECQEVLTLLGKDDSYADLYVDIARKSGDILDSWFWLGEEAAANLKVPLLEIRRAASSALEEFEKVVRIRRNTADQVRAVTQKSRDLIDNIPYGRMVEIGQFVHNLASLRIVRGELISLKDLRYVELPVVESAEKDVAAQIEKLSGLTVEFLLGEGALKPYQAQVDGLHGRIEKLAKGVEARRLNEDIGNIAKELELLIEIVSNLKIEDATQTTRIIEKISAIYSVLNQARAGLKRKNKELQSAEAVGEFASQSRLLEQALINYLDVCDAPAKCEEYLTRLMVQIEELEGRFADFEEFIVQLGQRREDISNAFETRKLELVEAHNRKTQALLAAAERILKGIKHRVGNLKSIDEINGYYASDLMVEKVRDLIRQLGEMGDSVKADDLQGRLKTVHENAVRQLKDRQEIFVADQNLIQLGQHRFSVNTQELDLTMVNREGEMYFHLTSTRFFEKVEDPEFLATRQLWGQECVSENDRCLSGRIPRVPDDPEPSPGRRACGLLCNGLKPSDWERSQEFMGPRYAEAYVKGVHDQDASHILAALRRNARHAGPAALPHAVARLCAGILATIPRRAEKGPSGLGKLRGYGTMKQLFPSPVRPAALHPRNSGADCGVCRGNRFVRRGVVLRTPPNTSITKSSAESPL